MKKSAGEKTAEKTALEVLHHAGIRPDRRAETLDTGEFGVLSLEMEKIVNSEI